MKRLDALKVAEEAFSEAETRGVKNISVVITDAGGHIRVAVRSDGQGIFGVETATAKAVTALGFNRATLALTPLFSDQATAAISGATHGRFAPLGGGVVVVDRTGAIIGGAAVSGGLPDVDHQIIVAALARVGFDVLA